VALTPRLDVVWAEKGASPINRRQLNPDSGEDLSMWMALVPDPGKGIGSI